MGLLHHDGHDAPHRRFKMQEKLVDIGNDYWIEDGDGNRVYKVNGKAARKRETFKLEDLHGHTVAKIQEKVLSVRNTVKIDLDGGSATVKKALVGIRDRFDTDRLLVPYEGPVGGWLVSRTEWPRRSVAPRVGLCLILALISTSGLGCGSSSPSDSPLSR